jgi:hypothetical protein
MTHSIDSFITDSANSATALYTGKKSTVNALGVYVDSVSLFLHSLEPPHLVPHSPRTPLTTPKLKPSLNFSVVALVVLSELCPLLTLPTRLPVCYMDFKTTCLKLTYSPAGLCSHTRDREYFEFKHQLYTN